ncbi:MAG: hypothetical protein KIS67_28605 [Verrucomicrobiae bacterium]|nr:hypothetical protein [Verrucomicrobiae bacterium]
MSVRRLQFALLPAALVLGMCLAAQGQQTLPQRSQKIIFSDPKGDPVSSNLNFIATQKLNLKSLEDEFKKPFSISGPGAAGSTAPLPLHLPQPNLNRQQLRELFERERDWIFQSPEDYESDLTAEKIFKIPEYGEDGQVKQKEGAVERFYQRLDEERAQVNRAREDAGNSVLFGNQESFGFAASRDLLELHRLKPGGNVANRSEANPVSGAAFISPDEIMRRLATGNNDSPLLGALTSADLSDLLSAGKLELLPQAAAQQARMEEFRQLLEPRAGSVLAGEATSELLSRSPSTSPSLDTSRSPSPLPEGAGFAAPGSLYPRAGVPERPQALITTTPGRPGSATGESIADPVRTVTPPPTFSLPKRAF